ncbi:MAG: DUF3035 domain-containing protein [Paracoccaceae bacterium]|nr:DUF3035 domain-containing protein [Paracoccaceae bacterium]
MRVARLGLVSLIVATMALTACGRNKEPSLMNISATKSTPDEFAILPNKPITQPKNYAELPAPTLGGSNLVDPTPRADAVKALGGNPKRLVATGVVRGDQGVYNYATRYGVAGNVREQLAAEDLDFRRRNNGKVLERWFNVNVYYSAYKKQSLDQYAELERFRKAGIRTPSAPPEGYQAPE